MMKKNKAFTLLEVLVTVTLVSVMSMAGIYIIAMSNKVIKENYDEAMARDNLRRLITEINRDIKQAAYAEVPSEINSVLTTSLPDGRTGVSWVFTRGFIMRYDWANGGTKREFNIIGADDYFAEGKFAFFPHGREGDSRYPSIETFINLKLVDKGGIEFQADSLRNVFYLRMDPEGFGYDNM